MQFQLTIPPRARQVLYYCWCATSVVMAIVSAWHYVRSREPVSPDSPAQIIGPKSVDYAGQYVAFHVTVPGRDPSKLIFAWTIEPVCPIAASQPVPMVRPTSNPGEAQPDAVAGHWRLSAAIADPRAKSAQIVSIDFVVPHEQAGVEPRPHVPNPPPLPGPPDPGPAPTPGPGPLIPFAQFEQDVRSWAAAVNSPDKATEMAAMATGAAGIVTSLKTGAFSRLSGNPLAIAVASDILKANNKVKNPAAWRQFFSNANTAAASARKAGQLNSAADFADFLAAFERGLK